MSMITAQEKRCIFFSSRSVLCCTDAVERVGFSFGRPVCGSAQWSERVR